MGCGEADDAGADDAHILHGVNSDGRKKEFFFEKKNQKTFAFFGARGSDVRDSE
jgi:hypothetical protein